MTWVNRGKESTTRPIEDLFVMIGAQPNTSWLKGVVALDQKGFVITGGLQGDLIARLTQPTRPGSTQSGT